MRAFPMKPGTVRSYARCISLVCLGKFAVSNLQLLTKQRIVRVSEYSKIAGNMSYDLVRAVNFRYLHVQMK